MVPNAQPVANEPHTETLLERAVKRHLAMLDRVDALQSTLPKRVRMDQRDGAALGQPMTARP